MQPHEVFTLYEELQQYVGWDAADVERVKGALPFLQPHLAALIEDFYATIDRHPNARKVISGGEEQVVRLKQSMRAWLEELLSGDYDDSYVTRRWKVGRRHVEIGLNQVYTNAALSRLRNGLTGLLIDHWQGDLDERGRTIHSLNKLLDLDLAIIEAAYQAENQKRHQQTERLAAIGQISAGVAHELRNPLNVVKTSVYYLLHAKQATPEKIREHLQRIERQVDVADGVTTALTDFAKLPLPKVEPVDVEACLREVLEVTTIPPHIEQVVEFPPETPPMLGDKRQLMIVFGNLIRNARDAMQEGGVLTISGTFADSHVSIAVADTGIGIKPDELCRIHEPLYSTKARGMGLGLAITRSILEKHAAQLEVASSPGEGSTFTVRIPAEQGNGKI